MADFSKLVGGTGDRAQIEAATAGWAAAALAGLAGYFQVTGSRATIPFAVAFRAWAATAVT